MQRTILDRLARQDPRLFQIGALGSLLLYGMAALHFDVSLQRAILLIGPASRRNSPSRASGASRPSIRERADLRPLALSPAPHQFLLPGGAAAVVTIASKFVLRVRGKHVFNPTNFGLVAMMLATGRVWVSPGQWGNGCLLRVPYRLRRRASSCIRAARSDVTYAFLALLRGSCSRAPRRSASRWPSRSTGCESGALLLFAFFMISDPKTTPDSRPGRILFAAVVARGARLVQFRLFRTNGLLGRSPLFRCSCRSRPAAARSAVRVASALAGALLLAKGAPP